MSPSQDPQGFYATLGVPPTATQDELRKAYRALARKLHPDLNPGNKQAEARFKKVSEAYDTLGDTEKRKAYDLGPTAKPEGGPRSAPGGAHFYYETQEGPQAGRYSRGFFEDLFGRFGSGGFEHEAPGSVDGDDALYRMEIDFKDAALGAEREITLPAGKRLKVRIPPGVDSGSRLRFARQGGPPRSEKGRPGDAYVELAVRPSPLFRREGRDVVTELPVSLPEALLGAEVPVPTLDGRGTLRVPAGVTTGSRLRIRGKGVAGRQGEPRGDQIVVLKVELPRSIDPEFRAAVEKWAREHPYDPREEARHAA